VQVAFDAAQRGGRIVDHIGAGLFQLNDPPLALGRSQQRAGQPHVSAAQNQHQPPEGIQRDHPTGRQQQIRTEGVHRLAK
jgi:hypothetical protein